MINYNELPNRSIACIDMMSFYASCIAVLHDLDVRTVPFAIVGNFDQIGSVVLAASPAMKKRFGVKMASTRLHEIPSHPDIRLFEPKMSYFLEMSMAVTELLHKYVPPEAVHVYSVDESFIDLTGTEKLWGPPENTVKEIQKEILESGDRMRANFATESVEERNKRNSVSFRSALIAIPSFLIAILFYFLLR